MFEVHLLGQVVLRSFFVYYTGFSKIRDLFQIVDQDQLLTIPDFRTRIKADFIIATLAVANIPDILIFHLSDWEESA